MKYVAASALILFGLAACAGPGAVTPDRGLMYEMPESPTLVYVSESSQDISVDIPSMGAMDIQGSSEATMAMTFAEVEGGLQITATFEKLTATMTNPMAGPVTASESDVTGDLVFTIDELGNGTLVSAPEVNEAVEQLVGAAGLAYEFFPSLPGESVEPGGTWTDTLHYDLEVAGGEATSHSVSTYTLVGDTVVDGVTLLHITYESDGEVVAQAEQQGMAVIQSFSGTTDGMFLWDPARSLMVAHETTSEMDGTTEMPASGMAPFPMVISATGSVHLQGG
jgi:hypothetical protein